MTENTVNIPLRLWELLVKAREEGWYEDDLQWHEVDRLIALVRSARK